MGTKNNQRLDKNSLTTNCSYAQLCGVYYNEAGFSQTTNITLDSKSSYQQDNYTCVKETKHPNKTYIKYNNEGISTYEDFAKTLKTPVHPVERLISQVPNRERSGNIIRVSKLSDTRIRKPCYDTMNISAWVQYSNLTKQLKPRNFGDDINFSFLPCITNSEHVLYKQSLKQKNFIMIGSIFIDKFVDNFTEVWGSGMLKRQELKNKPYKVHAVRGPITREIVLNSGIKCPEVYGDPALLIPYFYYPYVQKKYKFGIIPHHSHINDKNVNRFKNKSKNIIVINFTSYNDWKTIIKQIVECEFIVSESLHGLIIAEAFKIPNIWVSFGNINQDIKYEDFFLSVGKTPYSPTIIDSNTTVKQLLDLKSNYDPTFTLDLQKLVNACPVKLSNLNLAHNIKPYTGKVLLCCIGKMENNYIKEFVEYYKQIGFDNICLYDNNDIDGEKFDDVIGEYIDNGFVILKDWRGKKLAQIPAYTDCYMTYKDQYDWIAYFDIDEFIHLENDSDIKSFLSKDIFNDRGINTIRICWKQFTDSDIIKTNGNYSVTKFTDYLPITNRISKQSKIIIKTQLDSVTFTSPHGIWNNNSIVAVNTAGELCNNNIELKKPTWENACLYHYRFKTIEEYVLNKMVRLWPTKYLNGGKDGLTLDFFFKYNKRTPEKEEYAKYLLNKYNT